MDGVLKRSFKNFKYVFSSQLLVLLLSFIKSLFIPMILTVQGFGFWQIYLFYASYVGIFALGFNDGIYLRYGDYQYEKLPHTRLKIAIQIHSIVIFLFFIIALIFSSLINDPNKQFSMIFVSINIFVLGLNGVFIYVMQITNQMKKYSFFVIFPQIIFVLGTFGMILFRNINFEILIIIDLFAKVVTVIGMMLYCKELWFGRITGLRKGLEEYKANVSVGIQLMLAQLMGMLVTGIGRIIVEFFGNIEDYSYYSLGITITNLVLVLISSISMLAYPTLKRLNDKNYPFYYEKINTFLQSFSIIVPVLYFLSSLLIFMYLPKYLPVLKYLNILFGVIILQAKMQLLNNTFYKVLRKETEMMKANISSVLLFTVMAVIAFPLTESVMSIAVCTLIVMAYRCYSTEVYLRRILKLKNYKGIVFEALYIFLFSILTFLLNMKISFILYFCFLVIMVYKNRSLLNRIFKRV